MIELSSGGIGFLDGGVGFLEGVLGGCGAPLSAPPLAVLSLPAVALPLGGGGGFLEGFLGGGGAPLSARNLWLCYSYRHRMHDSHTQEV